MVKIFLFSVLKPSCVFEQFAKINQIPHPSKHEEKMIEFLKDFGESRNLETNVDKTGNVIIRKPATPGYEDRETHDGFNSFFSISICFYIIVVLLITYFF